VKKVKILVVCGTGIATSTVVSRKLEEKLPERGFNVETRQCKAAEVKENLNGIDLIVSTTPISEAISVPVIRTLAFLTGVREEQAIDEIVTRLKEVEKA
jgi:PTS system galactitol-specific IIB component